MNTEKKTYNKVSEVQEFNTNYLVGNTVVAKRKQLKYRLNGGDYWYPVGSKQEVTTISEIGSLVFYNHDGLTPEGEKMKAEADAKAKRDEEDED